MPLIYNNLQNLPYVLVYRYDATFLFVGMTCWDTGSIFMKFMDNFYSTLAERHLKHKSGAVIGLVSR